VDSLWHNAGAYNIAGAYVLPAMALSAGRWGLVWDCLGPQLFGICLGLDLHPNFYFQE